MNRPGWGVRFAGSPRVATVLYVGYAAIFLGWYEGQVAWWLAIIALGAAQRTLRAVGQLRRYKAWAADWQAMGADDDEPSSPPKTKRSRRWMLPTGAVLLVVLIPLCMPEQHTQGGLTRVLTLTWCWASVYLAVALLRRIRRRAKRPIANVEAVAGTAVPVAWLMGRASSSPSRADAMKSLPEYSARLMGA